MEYKTETTKRLQEQHILYHLKILYQQIEETKDELKESSDEYEKVRVLIKLMEELEEKINQLYLELKIIGS